MAVPVTIHKQHNICAQGAEVYVTKVRSRGKYTTEMMADDISQRCSLNRADVVGCIAAFEEIIAERLARGYTVVFDGLGWFRIIADSTLTSIEQAERRGFRVDDTIKSWKIRFHPSVRLRNFLKSGIECEFFHPSNH